MQIMKWEWIVYSTFPITYDNHVRSNWSFAFYSSSWGDSFVEGDIFLTSVPDVVVSCRHFILPQHRIRAQNRCISFWRAQNKIKIKTPWKEFREKNVANTYQASPNTKNPKTHVRPSRQAIANAFWTRFKFSRHWLVVAPRAWALAGRVFESL